MSPLRQQMIDAMVLRGLARRTQQAYLSVVAQLAAHYHCSPDHLDAAQVKAWLLHRITERHLAYTTVMTVLSRLADKGAAVRTPQGRGYAYAAVTDPAAQVAAALAAIRSGNLPEAPSFSDLPEVMV